MKHFLFSITALALVACAPETQIETEEAQGRHLPQTLLYKVAQYGDDWNVEKFWAGEYPKGIGIYREGVEVLARVTPHPDEPASTRCTLDYLASYHPWNEARSAADGLEFITAFKTYDMVVTQETEATAMVADEPETRTLQPGDQIKFIAYYGEGYGGIEIDGVKYDAPLGGFDPVEQQDMGASGNMEDDEWLGLDCGKERRYLRLSELFDVDGISFGLEGMSAYGRVADLTEEQATKLRSRTPK